MLTPGSKTADAIRDSTGGVFRTIGPQATTPVPDSLLFWNQES